MSTYDLGDIFSHLEKGELPLGKNEWKTVIPNELSSDQLKAVTQTLNQMISDAALQPCSKNKEWTRRLTTLNKIETLTANVVGEALNLKPLKSHILDSISKLGLQALNAKDKEPEKTKKEVARSLNAIWMSQRSDAATSLTESTVELQAAAMNRFASMQQKQEMQGISENLGLDQAKDFYSDLIALESAIENRDFAKFSKIVASGSFPLKSPINDRGETLLHVLLRGDVAALPEMDESAFEENPALFFEFMKKMRAGAANKEILFNFAEFLLKHDPTLIDQTDGDFNLPKVPDHLTANKYPTLVSARESIGKPLQQPSRAELEKSAQEYPNILTLKLREAIYHHSPDTEVCEWLRHASQAITGPRAANLLHAAIDAGNILIVKQLLDLGVKPQGVLIPLHQAVKAQNLDVIALLLERGADFSETDAHGKSVMDVIKETPSLSQNMRLRRLIEGRLESSEALTGDRLNVALATENWSEVVNILKAGYRGDISIEPLVLEAIKNRQSYLIRVLIEGGYIQNVTIAMLKALIQYGTLAEVVWCLSALQQKGQNIEEMLKQPDIGAELLNAALAIPDYPIAAYLVKLGADPQLAESDVEGLIQYSNLLSKGSHAEQKFRALLNAKNVAHLVGDAVVQEMRSDTGDMLEGNLFSESLAFHCAALELALEQNPGSELANELLGRFAQAEEIALQLESLGRLKDPEKLGLGIENVEKEINSRITHLQPNESVLIPAGCTRHAILIECKRLANDQIEVNIINTGKGTTKYHGVTHDMARAHVNTTRQYRMSMNEFDASHVLRKILEPAVQTPYLSEDKTPYGPEDIYGVLDQFFVGEKPCSNDLEPLTAVRKAQLSGTCSLRCCLAYCKLKMAEEEYKSLKPVMAENTVTFALEQNELLIGKQPKFAKLLSLVTPHLLLNLEKRLAKPWVDIKQEEARLDRLENLQNELLRAIPPANSENETVPIPPTFPTRSKNLSATLTELSERSERNLLDALVGASTPIPAERGAKGVEAPKENLNTVNSVEALMVYMEEMEKYVQGKMASELGSPQAAKGAFISARELQHHVMSTVNALGRAILDDTAEYPLKDVMAKVRNNPEAAEQLIAHLDTMTKALCQLGRMVKDENSGRTISIHYALITSWEMSKSIEEAQNVNQSRRVEQYGLSLESVQGWQKDLRTNLLLDAKLEKDVQMILTYASRQRVERGLFAFETSPDGSGWSIKTPEKEGPSADFAYAKAIAEHIPEWEEADRAYTNAIETKRSAGVSGLPDIGKEEWRIHWAYAHRLPPHIEYVRRLAYLAHYDMIGHLPPEPMSDQLQNHLSLTHETPLRRNREGNYIAHPTMCFYKMDHELLLPQSLTNVVSALPPDAGGVQISNASWRKTDLSLLPLNEQNDEIDTGIHVSNRELMSIRCAISTFSNTEVSALAIPLLIDYFDVQHLNELAQHDRRIFFEYTLFAPQRLPLALKVIPDAAQHLHDFFKQAIAHFEDKIISGTAIPESAAALAFLETLWQRTLLYVQQAGIKEINGTPVTHLMREARAKIRSMLGQPPFSANDVQQQLVLGMLESYHGEPFEPKELVENIAIFHRLIQSDGPSKRLVPAFFNSALSVMVERKEAIYAFLTANPQNASQVLRDVAKQYDIELPEKVEWSLEKYPLCSCQFGNTILEFDVMNGRFLINHQEPTDLPLSLREQSPAYQELFGERKLIVVDCGKYYETSDRYGDIQILTSGPSDGRGRVIEEIRRNINGSWYSYLPKQDPEQHPPMPSIAGKDRLGVWVSEDKPVRYLFVEPSTMEPVIKLDHDGHLIFLREKSDARWEWVDESVLDQHPIMDIDPSTYLLQQGAPDELMQMRLQLPHILDESGIPLEFQRTVKEDRGVWVLKGKQHLHIAEDQRLPFIRNFNNFIVMSSSTGEKEVMIPVKTLSELQAHKDMAQIHETSIITASIKTNAKGNESLSAQSTNANLYLAYLSLTHAATPKEYQQAMEFLRSARKFERYTPEELRLLGWIFQSDKLTKDHTGLADAVRLFTAWLVHDNLKRNPPEVSREQEGMAKEVVPLSPDSPAAEWQLFWEGKHPKENLRDQIKTLAVHYFARQQHLPEGMRIHDSRNLSPQELMDWSLEDFVTAPEMGKAFPEQKQVINVTVEDIELIRSAKKSRGTPQIPVQSRARGEMGENFIRLLDAAKSHDPQRRRLVEDQLKAMRFDQKSRVFAEIIGAVLNPTEKTKKLLECLSNIQNKEVYDGPYRHDTMMEFATELQNILKEIPSYYQPIEQPVPPSPVVPMAQVLPPPTQIILPDTPPRGEPLAFTASHTTNIEDFQALAKLAFKEQEAGVSTAAELFELDTTDEWLKEGIAELNRDYLLGVEKNQRDPHYSLSDQVSIDDLLDKQRPAIVKEAKNYSEPVLKEHEEDILRLANRIPTDEKAALKYRAEVASGRKNRLEIGDCVRLFLDGDIDAYRHATGLESNEEIAKLHQMIGDFIVIHNKANRYNEVIKAFNRLEKAYRTEERQPEKVNSALQRLAEELNVQTAVDPNVDPRVLIVFEYGLGLALRENQVQGIKDMNQAVDDSRMRFRSVLLQRIQGGGKSLVFGHIMAQMKADGYHLSVHVPSTAQYQTAVYDMSSRSEHLFGQRERTLEFDDHPLKFTPEYLTSVLNMMKEAVVNREYITMTKESLQAMRCKYLKTRFEILKSSPESDVRALEASNQILKQILVMLRGRAIFTFDEMHLTFDPMKELNMPYGQPEKPNTGESRLLGKIISLAVLAEDKQGPLLDIKHTAQQTEEQYTEMIKQIVAGLSQEPPFIEPGVKEYINGERAEIPEEFDTPDRRDDANLVILARQMLTGNWLKDRLEQNVDEHHGIAPEGYPLVSIPFIANMVPAIGSEFSDKYVMTTNSLIAYLAKGLYEKQTVDLINYCRSKAEAQKREINETRACALAETPICADFFAATGIHLFSVNRDNIEQIKAVQNALVGDSRNVKAIDLLLQYVIDREISQVELYENQVCSNGQNVASMGQSFVAYSGSMENSNMAPVGSIPKPEEGTNGQTIDLLIRHQTPVHVVSSDQASLLTMLQNHPDKEKIHALIDVGAYFRGIENEKVALMICESLSKTHSAIKGVLFFEAKTGKLCMMQCDPPHGVKKISKTTPEAIKAETGLSNDQLFTYYDQDHTTGIDITQDEEAIGITTMSEHTEIHEILQGTRRLRQLDLMQRVEMVVPESALDKIATTSGKEFVAGLPTIKDLLLYANITETDGQKQENMLYCLQKMENLVQQFILDKLYHLDENSEKELFAKTGYLFEKNVAVDLYKEYAKARKSYSKQEYLGTIREMLLGPLQGVLDPKEIDQLRLAINTDVLNDQALKGIESEIDVSHGFNPLEPAVPLANRNSETSRLQVKQQERISEQQQVQEQESMNIYLNQVESRRNASYGLLHKESPFSPEQFFSREFGEVPIEIDMKTKTGCCWSVDRALRMEIDRLPDECRFNENLLVTNNGAMIREDELSLIGPKRKKPWTAVVICDEDPEGGQRWKTVLGSIEDGKNFLKYMTEQSEKLQGRTMWLVRANGKKIAGPEALDIDADPQLSQLMTQTLFFTGDFESLSRKPWQQRVQQWMEPMNEATRQGWIKFFEEEILMGMPPGYASSRLYRLFHP